MSEIGKESIYSFSRTENLGLPYSTFISPDRAEGLQDLIDRVESLELENANLRDRLQDLEGQAEQRIKDIEITFKSILNLRAGLEKLERKEPSEKTTKPYLDKIAARLIELRSTGRPAGLALQDAAKLLDLTGARMSQLRPTIEADRRFRIEQRGRRKIICLR